MCMNSVRLSQWDNQRDWWIKIHKEACTQYVWFLLAAKISRVFPNLKITEQNSDLEWLICIFWICLSGILSASFQCTYQSALNWIQLRTWIIYSAVWCCQISKFDFRASRHHRNTLQNCVYHTQWHMVFEKYVGHWLWFRKDDDGFLSALYRQEY